MRITLHQEVAGGKAGDTIDTDDTQAQQLIAGGYASAASGASGGDDDGPPARAASKSDWIVHAVSQGASQEDAEAMTKAELVEKYG
jgi:hypothetical protein